VKPFRPEIQPISRIAKKVARIPFFVYFFLNTPAMPLAVRGHAHFGGFFIARSFRA
jgi:hypothetical protein